MIILVSYGPQTLEHFEYESAKLERKQLDKTILLNINRCNIVLCVLFLCYKEKHGSRLPTLLYSYTN